MNNKNTLIFECQKCGAQFPKWSGRCLECGQWGSLTETFGKQKNEKQNQTEYPAIKTVSLKDIKDEETKRTPTKISELDRVLGGGIVPGCLILLGGEPGIGKSTLSLQLSSIIPRTLYISGEESAGQIKLRADRLKIKAEGLKLGNETDMKKIISTLKKEKPALAVIDSIQTVYSSEVAGESGNINQVKACAVKLMEAAKQEKIPIVLIGQVTKDGNVAGPKTLEHLVDTVLYLEGDKYHQYRLLRTVKNRFGPTDEIGVFSMEENGLQEVKNPSQSFLSNQADDTPGSSVACLMEGTRPMLIEIQALVTKTSFGYPQRKAAGFDLNRLQMLIAVLSKRAGLPLESYDVFLNIAGGLKVNEPACDLAVILAIASAAKNKSLPAKLISFGEVGLGGEVRGASHTDKRLSEAKKMGFEFAAIPHLSKTKTSGIKIAKIKNVKELVEKIVKA